ncbi:MAG: DICT sensory domain-containing protein [Nocardioidaceae bacterium]
MPVAVERAKSQVEQPAQSVFAGLRRRHRDLRVQLLRKPAVLALSRAIEDECCAQADSPLLFASFQRERFYRASEARWKELSRTARSAVVFADFDRPMPFSHRPVEVPIPFAAPLNREWILVCDSPDYPGCVVGWERPGRSNASDRTRGFETLWSVEPRVVREAARMCAALSEQYRPGLSLDQWTPLEVTPPEAAAETRRASGILDRMLTYLSASSEQA